MKSAYDQYQLIASNLGIYNKYICCHHLIFLPIKQSQQGLTTAKGEEGCRHFFMTTTQG
jgi:hypothetical protein